MGSRVIEEQVLRATLCEIERGLFHVLYRMEGVGLGQHHLPRYQVGASASDARRRVEQRARECGYETVAWETEVAEPVIQWPAADREMRLAP